MGFSAAVTAMLLALGPWCFVASNDIETKATTTKDLRKRTRAELENIVSTKRLLGYSTSNSGGSHSSSSASSGSSRVYPSTSTSSESSPGSHSSSSASSGSSRSNPSSSASSESSPSSSGSSSSDSSKSCLGHCQGNGKHKVCTFNFKVDLFASELGYFQVKECGDQTNPTLGIQTGVTYHFNQWDLSNYMHPLGFAYFPDGAHDDKDELEPGIKPPGSSSDCDSDKTCPAPMYMLNGEYLGKYSNIKAIARPTTDEEDFGLDVYEPDFLRDPVTWSANGKYSVALKFDDIDHFTGDIFYFCHVHQFMTGRIKFVDKNGDGIKSQDKPKIPYSYDVPSDYDKSCGTYNLEQFQLPNKECPHRFVCGIPDSDDDPDLANFADCIESMDCAMTAGMTTGLSSKSAIALFNHQMIPHHQNAVNMAKALLKANEIDCDDITDEDDDDCVMLKIMYEIINGQNHQIQQMRDVLENKGYVQEDDCVVKVKQHSRRLLEA